MQAITGSPRLAGSVSSLSSKLARSLRIGLPMCARARIQALKKQQRAMPPSVKELCTKFIEDYSKPKNRPRTVESNQGYIDRHIVPNPGTLKAREVTRPDVSSLVTRMKKTPVTANRILSCLRKMFNMAEVLGFRDDSTNPCWHIPKYPESGKTRLITDDEMVRLFGYLDRADVEGLEHPFVTLGIRLQFAFAARMSEIISMRWEWVDFDNRRAVWPDSETGEISKPMTDLPERANFASGRSVTNVSVTATAAKPGEHVVDSGSCRHSAERRSAESSQSSGLWFCNRIAGHRDRQPTTRSQSSSTSSCRALPFVRRSECVLALERASRASAEKRKFVRHTDGERIGV